MWAVGYWLVYPAWPTLHGYTKGVLGYSQRGEVDKEVAAAKAAQAKYLRADRRDAARATSRRTRSSCRSLIAGGAAVFGDNCARCHGQGAQGAVGYPNLNDDDWLWGGTAEAIERPSRTASAPAIRKRTRWQCHASGSTAS